LVFLPANVGELVNRTHRSEYNIIAE
jgi:hypothetical protein